MNEMLTLAIALAAGMMLGGIFFGGLLWTVRKGIAASRPAFWFLGSLLLRTGIILAGFYFVSDGHPERLLACLAGFVIGRFIVTRLTARPVENHHSPVQEAGHAP